MKKLINKFIFTAALVLLLGACSTNEDGKPDDTAKSSTETSIATSIESSIATGNETSTETVSETETENKIQLKDYSKVELTSAVGKAIGYGNPLITNKFGADPYAMVYNDRVYIYMTNDVFEYDKDGAVKENTYGTIKKITIISSDDLVNWTDHGEVQIAGMMGVTIWANNSWAPAAAYKNINGEDKFFLYFGDGASRIGVLTSDSPTGPWIDPINKPLIDRSIPGAENVAWCFDPAVLMDDDGSYYMYFGGGIPDGMEASPDTLRVIKLGEDMISVDGSAITISAPYAFEDAGTNKYNGKYYFSYCTNFSSGTRPAGSPGGGEIAYMISDSPTGPFEYVKSILKNPYAFFGVGGNNHHAIFDFRGKWYITYHAQTLAKALDETKGYRSTHINEVFFDEDGIIKDIKGDMFGITQVSTLDPYKQVEAETIAWNGGIDTENPKAGQVDDTINLNVTDINSGDWICIAGVDFGDSGAKTFYANVASGIMNNESYAGVIELRLDFLKGPVVGTLPVLPTGGWHEWEVQSTDVEDITGVHNLYLVFLGEGTENLFNMDYWRFE